MDLNATYYLSNNYKNGIAIVFKTMFLNIKILHKKFIL
jgi:hypothetical protein